MNHIMIVGYIHMLIYFCQSNRMAFLVLLCNSVDLCTSSGDISKRYWLLPFSLFVYLLEQ